MLLLHKARRSRTAGAAPPPQAAKAGDACFAPAEPGRAAPRTRTLQGPYEGPQRSARPKTITL